MRGSGGHFGLDFCRLGGMSGLAWRGPAWGGTLCSCFKQSLEISKFPQVKRMEIQTERTEIKSTDVKRVGAQVQLRLASGKGVSQSGEEGKCKGEQE